MKTSVMDQILLNCISIAEKRIEINNRRVCLKSEYENTCNSDLFNSDPFILKRHNEIRQIRNFTKDLLFETIKNPNVVNEIEGGLNNYISNRSVFIYEIGCLFMNLHSFINENEHNNL